MQHQQQQQSSKTQCSQFIASYSGIFYHIYMCTIQITNVIWLFFLYSSNFFIFLLHFFFSLAVFSGKTMWYLHFIICICMWDRKAYTSRCNALILVLYKYWNAWPSLDFFVLLFMFYYFSSFYPAFCSVLSNATFNSSIVIHEQSSWIIIMCVVYVR